VKVRSAWGCVVLAALFLCLGVQGGGSATLAGGGALWGKRYDGPAHKTDAGEAIARSADGTKVFVAGLSYGGSALGYDYVTLAYNASTGAKAWASRYNGPGSGLDAPTAIAVSPDGTKVYVTGESFGNSTTGQAYATVAYNASTGAKVWATRYNGPADGSDKANSVAVSPDGTRVFVTGVSWGGATPEYDYATVAYNAVTGAQVWAQRYNGPGSEEDAARSVAVSSDGTKVFVTGGSDGGGNTADDYATAAYDAATGAKLWLKRYDALAHSTDRAESLAVSPTALRIFVTGQSYGGAGTAYDYATVAYNFAGTKLWSIRYNGSASQNDYGYALTVSADGSKVFVTGGSDGSGSFQDYGTVGYNASTGAKLWSTRYNGPGNSYDAGYSIGVNPAGTKLFVTGESYGGPAYSFDGATVAYNPTTGSKLWATRNNGPANMFDRFKSLAVSADGANVFVAGESDDTSTGRDVVTVSYKG
jgi:DNA-binding beta-propeller fold protein YncE